MKRCSSWLMILAVAAAGWLAAESRGVSAEGQAAGKVYELRTYIANPGKFDALLARFRDHTCQLFKKHGVEVVGFWTPTEGDEAQNTLIYLVVFPSVEAQKEAWTAFRADPEWIRVKAESEKDGAILKEPPQSKNLKATDFSPLR